MHISSSHDDDDVSSKHDSTTGILCQFLSGKGVVGGGGEEENEGTGNDAKQVSKDALFDSLANQTIEKHCRIQKILDEADNIRDSGTRYDAK